MSENGVVEELTGQDQGVGEQATAAGGQGGALPQPSGVGSEPTAVVSGAAIAEAEAGAGEVAAPGGAAR